MAEIIERRWYTLARVQASQDTAADWFGGASEHLQKKEVFMAGAKLIVLYPSPRDVNTFERAYTQDHAPMVTAENFKGIKKFVASKVVGTADGSAPPFSRIAELHFPSLEALQAAAGSASAQKVVAHAVSISSGGKPTFLIAEEVTKTF